MSSPLSPIILPGILAKTQEWLVLDKPPGWLTIPGREKTGHERRPVLLEWAEKKEGKLFVVHRIDRDTSGVLLFARTPEAHRKANEWFRKHQVRKIYECLASGVPAAPTQRIRKPIEGAPSLTQVEVLETYPGAFLGRAFPQTGRRHQIRVHLSQVGNPLLGDREYRGPDRILVGGKELSVPRVALHASRLELPSGESFEAPWPEDFAGWVEELRHV